MPLALVIFKMVCNCAAANCYQKTSTYAKHCYLQLTKKCIIRNACTLKQSQNLSRSVHTQPRVKTEQFLISKNARATRPTSTMGFQSIFDRSLLCRQFSEGFIQNICKGFVQQRCFYTLSQSFKNANDSTPQTMEVREEDRTKINIINKHMSDNGEFVPYISKYSTIGFTIGKDKVIGSVAILPKGILSWKVLSHHQITQESLMLFTVLQPKIEILVLGVGDKVVQLPNEIWKFAKESNIALEVLDTPNACATFNFLTEEGRRTAAALIPPAILKP